MKTVVDIKSLSKVNATHLEHPAPEQSLVQTDSALDRISIRELDVGKAVLAEKEHRRTYR